MEIALTRLAQTAAQNSRVALRDLQEPAPIADERSDPGAVDIDMLLTELQQTGKNHSQDQRGFSCDVVQSSQEFCMKPRDWFLCLQQFIPHATSPNLDERHVCSSSCEFFAYKTHLYVCRSTGQLHICTAGACNRLIRTKEDVVCEVTALAYPRDIPISTKQDDYVFDELAFQRAADRVKHKPNERTLEQRCRDHEIRETVKRAQKAKPTLNAEERKEIRDSFGYQRKAHTLDRYSRQMEALYIINRVFGDNLEKVKKRLDLQVLADCCVDWFVMCQQQLQADREERSDYKFNYHVLACLYIMKNGNLSFEGVPVIPYNETISRNIIQQKQLKNVFQNEKKSGCVSSKRLTVTIKILKGHLVLTEQEIRSYQPNGD